MNKKLLKIINKFENIVILSPHTDDAALSCGSLLLTLAGKSKITVVNVFSNADKKPYTISAKVFMNNFNGYNDASELYKERVNEDKDVLSTVSITPVDLGLKDALFRKKKKRTFLGKYIAEIDTIYPTYRFHILGKISEKDEAISLLRNVLVKYKNEKTLILAPYGIGNHIDHRIVRMVSEELFTNLILYSDFPYNIRTGSYGSANKNQYVVKMNPDIKRKKILLKGYKTQINGLFPNGNIPNHQEVYFINKNL